LRVRWELCTIKRIPDLIIIVISLKSRRYVKSCCSAQWQLVQPLHTPVSGLKPWPLLRKKVVIIIIIAAHVDYVYAHVSADAWLLPRSFLRGVRIIIIIIIVPIIIRFITGRVRFRVIIAVSPVAFYAENPFFFFRRTRLTRKLHRSSNFLRRRLTVTVH